MASPSGSNGKMAFIPNSGQDSMAWRTGLSQSKARPAWILCRYSFEDMGICQHIGSYIILTHWLALPVCPKSTEGEKKATNKGISINRGKKLSRLPTS